MNDLYGESSAAGVAVGTARALAGLGLDTHFLATVQRPEEAGAFEEAGVKVRRIFTPPYPVRWRAHRSMNNRPAVEGFARALEAIGPDVVHFHNLHIHFSYRALRAARECGAFVILTVHDVMPFCFHKMFCFLDKNLIPGSEIDYRARFFKCLACTRFRFNPLRNRTILRDLRRWPHHVIAVSGPMRDALEANGLPVHGVIPNGIDLTEWAPAPGRREAFRKTHGLEGAAVILHGGRLDALKGGLHLVRAAARVAKRLPGVILLLPGEGGAFRGEMEAEARRSGFEARLRFTGWLTGEDLKGAYEAADVVASPSLCFESFNLINLEGMAMARPVVTSFFGDPPRWWSTKLPESTSIRCGKRTWRPPLPACSRIPDELGSWGAPGGSGRSGATT